MLWQGNKPPVVQRRFKVQLAVRTALGGIFLSAITPVHGQTAAPSLADTAEAVSVGSRSKANYDAAGISVGTFRLYTSAEGSFVYNDNVYNTQTMRLADIEAILKPHIELRSQSPDYYLDLDAQGEIDRYAKLHAEDSEQYNLGANGRFNIGQSAAFTANAFYSQLSALRGTLGDVVVGAPNQYHRLGSIADISVELNNVTLTARGSVETDKYEPVELDGASFPQSFRNDTGTSESLRASIRVGPTFRLFGEGNYNTQAYKKQSGGLDRNSHGYTVLGGVEFGITALISGEIGIGYLSQTYKGPLLPHIGGVSYNAKVLWNPTPLLSATLTGGRTLEQSPFFNPAGVVEDNVSLRLDYELLRDLIIVASERFTADNYRGLDRIDHLYTTDLSARFLVSRTLELGLNVDYRHQSSNGPLARRYAGTSGMISIIVKR
jgi:hypothetical protein